MTEVSDRNDGKQVPPRFWWWPWAACVAFTPVAVALAVLSHGWGHGDGSADDVLFPLHRPLRILVGELPAERLIYYCQFALYGVLLSIAARYRKLALGVGCLACLHLACYLGRDGISKLIIEWRPS